MIQITAYECMGAWHLQATRADATESGYQWAQLISELVEIPSWVEGDTWDVVWLIAGHLHRHAMRHTEAGRPQD